ncbi:hypothetical protein [Micromonospora sp. RTP1Z1]|uniref:DUF7144 family membrane protein n=1 Tax=Micromonospora sp. RTP1Z1 TaxID=2994043 RepID=UPI0029C6E581|nr:hypothetical protein [Micromonospora sp. RTP1Z1]
MAEHEAGTPGRRPVLAGLLLAGAGLFDGLSGLGGLDHDPYVLFTRSGLYHLDLTGWMWAHLVTGVVMVAGGMLAFSGRRWPVRLAGAAAVVGLVFHLLVFAYEPIWALMVIGLAVAALRLLWQCRSESGERVISAGRPSR